MPLRSFGSTNAVGFDGWSLPEIGNFHELSGMMKPSGWLIIPHSDSISAGNLQRLIVILQQLAASKSLLSGENHTASGGGPALSGREPPGPALKSFYEFLNFFGRHIVYAATEYEVLPVNFDQFYVGHLPGRRFFSRFGPHIVYPARSLFFDDIVHNGEKELPGGILEIDQILAFHFVLDRVQAHRT